MRDLALISEVLMYNMGFLLALRGHTEKSHIIYVLLVSQLTNAHEAESVHNLETPSLHFSFVLSACLRLDHLACCLGRSIDLQDSLCRCMLNVSNITISRKMVAHSYLLLAQEYSSLANYFMIYKQHVEAVRNYILSCDVHDRHHLITASVYQETMPDSSSPAA